MDPGNTPFNALIVGPTNSGKTQFLVNQLCGPFNGKFDHIVLICPTFAYNRTLYRFSERDPRLYVIICEQHQVEIWLKLASFSFEGTNTLIILDDCAASKDVKGRTGELVKLGFSTRHAGISVRVLVFSVTPFKIDQNKKSKPFNRLSLQSGNRKEGDMQRLSPRFRSRQFFLWEICGETFFPNL